MKRGLRILGALALTGTLLCLYPLLQPEQIKPEKGVGILRVWIGADGAAAGPWLRKQAAAYERQGGKRVYLRTATAAEIQAAEVKGAALMPDLIVSAAGDTLLARQGYALIVRQEGTTPSTPAPTSALFYPPAPSPGVLPTPAAAPEAEKIGSVVGSRELASRMENLQPCADPAVEIRAGRCSAAMLTATQAGTLPFGYQAYGLKNAWLPLAAQAMTEDGDEFAAFLLMDTAQQALRESGLFAASAGLRLYSEQDSLRALIESAINAAD